MGQVEVEGPHAGEQVDGVAAGPTVGAQQGATSPPSGDLWWQLQGADAGVVALQVAPEQAYQPPRQRRQGRIVHGWRAFLQVAHQQVADRAAGDRVAVDQLGHGALPDAPADPLGDRAVIHDAEVVQELLGGDRPEVGLAQRPASLAVGKQVGGDEPVEAADGVDQHIGQHPKRLAEHGRAHSRPPARRDQAGMLALVGGGEQQDLEGLQALAEQPGVAGLEDAVAQQRGQRRGRS